MAESSRPYTNNGTNDGTSYTALQWRSIYRNIFGNGVISGLAVSGTTSPLSVAAGAAWIDGVFYENTSAVPLTVATPAALTAGHVVLRVEMASGVQKARVYAVRATSGDTTVPALTQTSESTYEIRLASFTISAAGAIVLTDTRPYLHANTRVSTAMIDDDNITNVKLADNSVGTAEIIDGSVGTAELANDAVDDTKVGARVPQFYRRKGGSSTDWSSAGVTDYTPTAVRMQAGASSGATLAPGAVGSVSITFPVAFSQPPIVLLTAIGGDVIVVNAQSVTASGFTARLYNTTTSGGSTSAQFTWLAVGPE